MSGPTYNQPAQPSYGEGMADALKAQVELLTGTGDFASTGSLESLLPLEESIRKKTAQTDTDILRQTLLGGTTGGGQQEVTYDADGRIVIGTEEAPSYQIKQLAETLKSDGTYGSYDSARANKGGSTKMTLQVVGPGNKVLDTVSKTFTGDDLRTELGNLSVSLEKKVKDNTDIPDDFKSTLTNNVTNSGFYQGTDPGQDVGGNFATGSKIFSAGEGAPIYAKDTDGKIIQDASKAGTTEVTTLPTQRQGDGMVDLLGDKRSVQNTVAKEVTKTATQADVDSGKANTVGEEFTETVYEQVESGRQAGFDEAGNFLGLSAYGEDIQAGNLSRQRERDLQDVARLSGTYQDIMEDYKPGTQEALESAREVLEGQKDSLTGAGAIGGPKGITDPLSLTSKGFTAAQNTTPINLTGDTSFTGAEVADPMSLTAKTEYDELTGITGQKLTADTTYIPTTNVTGGTFNATTSYNAAQAADPLALSAATSYDPSAGVTGTGYSAVAGLDGGQIQADSLRARLMKDAEAGLDQGLTDREKRQIAEAARARSTMMGRTFDQSGAIAEAEARVAEDNARKMQNRAFAQSALGQEAGLQESDLGRGLQAAMQNQAAQNQALQYSSGQDMQAQLANQAATNQALQAGMAAGLSQEALAAQQKQAQEFANMQASNRASEFGVSAGMDQQAQSNQQALNAALANQQASNRAAEFGVQAGLGQEQAQAGFAQQANLANLAAEQQRQETGLQAGLGQEQLRASLAQQKAMADAGFTQQARAAGLEAGLTQEQAEAQLNQQRLMANQQFSQEANKYGAQEDMQVQLNNLANQISNYQFETGAQMDADRLNEQLKQSGILGYIQAAGGLAALEDSSTLDPFQAVLGRGGGGSLQAGQSVFGQAGYGLNSGPAYLNPESGLGYIQNQATNAANMYNAQVAADATKTAGIFSGLGSLGGGLLGNAGLFG